MREPEASSLPRHIAIIMDGNGRWARRRLLPRQAGHRAGLSAARRVIESCVQHGIGALTLFAFSSENWQRPPPEVGSLMGLFMNALESEVAELHKNRVRIRFIGARAQFSTALQQGMHKAEQLTVDNTGLRLNVAAGYGGRWELLQAARQLASEVLAGRLRPEELDEPLLANALSLAGSPDPDLFIRTGGEQRISNFLLWQLAYTELYFTDTLWPDFDAVALQQALNWYTQRQRRFGRTPEQLESPGHA
ncbi:MAG: di-trans,poly-cis-decaprenylcistransferase [Gammaproteobacteria bacterium]|nr:di-trans,poly-cis-decaprenylcistransferase [Gammaproteobacteria bacterium]MBU6508810.1 di-trans,poly-cis-decaprenylcistransferase [Gammaproteobacteria bacterium]MDE1983148.1 di-trans,poly-cis-decaprenylcistransferase [Gammaproteobacteria bacterium]MDE2108998.1 di-trans,poly-cis-decaprenylcistransferase [Gammaproteobacteria bacterium]MDE2460880.1 di-trans,poly-cis-decaprenylcistransferase [Gammaproteobacteria bacterium]